MQGLGSRAFMKMCKQNAASWQSAESSLELQRDILWQSCAHSSSLQTETDCNVSAVYLHLWSRCDYLQKPVNVSESDCSSFESDGFPPTKRPEPSPVVEGVSHSGERLVTVTTSNCSKSSKRHRQHKHRSGTRWIHEYIFNEWMNFSYFCCNLAW